FWFLCLDFLFDLIHKLYLKCNPETLIHLYGGIKSLSPKDLLAPVLYHGYYIRPRINKQLERGFSQVESEDDWYRVLLDVCQFTPDEISVRTVDNLLEVTGRHAQRMDQHGFVSREFARTHILPMGVDPLLVQVSLSHDGILCIQAPRKTEDLEPKINQLKIKVDKKESKS
uniref:Heat shock protein, alpha-crystallin-related, b2 n=2 Tax=Cyprinus carpio TaxID=7962 RepID=A0A8C1DGK8_CYPCA